MSEIKIARTDYPILEPIAKRWSPCAYSDRMVSTDDLHSVFEAARWAASNSNEQPWYYIIGTKNDPEQYSKVLLCLNESNQKWAKAAPVLALGVVSTKFKRNNKPNRHAFHDLGQASANLSIEATARGLSVHQMGGILPDKAKVDFDIPDDHEVVTGIAIGYVGPPESAPEGFRERDITPRQRRPSSEWVFIGTWGETHPLFKK
jgi:nitroreductase